MSTRAFSRRLTGPPGAPLSEKEIEELVRRFDADDVGEINYHHFTSRLEAGMVDKVVVSIRRRLKRKSKEEVRHLRGGRRQAEGHAGPRRARLRDREARLDGVRRGAQRADGQVRRGSNGAIDFSEFSRIMPDGASDARAARAARATTDRRRQRVRPPRRAVGPEARKTFKEFDQDKSGRIDSKAREGREAHAARHGPHGLRARQGAHAAHEEELRVRARVRGLRGGAPELPRREERR